MVEGVELAVYISVLFKKLYPEIKSIPREIYKDNKSLYDALQSHEHVYDKWLKIDIGVLKKKL